MENLVLLLPNQNILKLLISVCHKRHQKEIDRNSQADISPTWLNTLRIGEKLYIINDTKNDILLPKDIRTRFKF